MKKFKVVATYKVYLTLEVEAKDEDQAYDIARNTDGGSFDRQGESDWNIDEVIEIKE